ncbi:MAG: hypothetical protein K6E62_09905 [Lachnospiraceae bacterium]|nr:hypothetical protein [Lachnospiraceae bacterium]
MNLSGIAKTAAVSVLILAAVLISKDRVYGGLCAAFLIYVAVREFRSSKAADYRIKYLDELDRFCGNLKHHFYRTGSVRDAVFFGMDRIKQPLKKDLKEIFGMLESADIKTLGGVYQNSDKDKYLRLLLSLLMLIDENGDDLTGEGSVFMNSVMQLKMEAKDERRFIVTRRHKFMGLTLTAALPSATVLFIAAWGVSTNHELMTFYYGRAGTVFRMAILFVSLICYRITAGLREPDAAKDKEIRLLLGSGTVKLLTGLKLASRRIILFSMSGLVMLIAVCASHHDMKELLKTDVSNINMLCDVADGRQILAMENFIPKYTAKYAGQPESLPAADELAVMFLDEDGIRTDEVAGIASKEVIRRVDMINRQKPDLIDVIIVIAAGLTGAVYPYIGILFDRIMRDSRIKDEIMQFQTIIGIQKDVPGINPAVILESLESFSSIFRPYLKKCLNDYGVNENEALTVLRHSVTDPDFERIAECFMMADELGIKDAFDEIASEIRTFREDRRAERSIQLDNDTLLGSLTAIIPGGLILFGYLLIPFMVSALNMFNSYQDSLKDYISIT